MGTPVMMRPAVQQHDVNLRAELALAERAGASIDVSPDGEGELGNAFPPLNASAVRRAFPPLRAAQQRLDLCVYLDPIAILAVVAVIALSDGAAWPTHLWSRPLALGNALALAALPWATVVGLRIAGLYEAATYLSGARRALRLAIGLAAAPLVASLGVLAISSALAGHGPGTANAIGDVVTLWALAVAAVVGVRAVVFALTSPLASAGVRQVIVVGTGPRAVRLYRERYADIGDRVELLGLVTPTGAAGGAGGAGGAGDETSAPVLGTVNDLEHILAGRSVDEVLIALPVRLCYAEIQHALEACGRVGVPAMYIDDVFTTPVDSPNCRFVTGAPMVRLRVAPEDHRLLVKRAIDLVMSLAGLALLSPVLVAAALAIKLTSRGPVIFKQERYGHRRRRFTIYKFRTMVTDAEQRQDELEEHNEADGPLFKIREDPRMTPVGRVLRRTSIDVLPQLINVVLGNMSLVGPRPFPMRDVERFGDPALMRRFSVLPGVTGPWQVSGRSELGFKDCVRYDLDYIDKWSLRRDFNLLVQTIPAVLRGHGAA
jgi:exopolysaccharide biosynthesis polyprenyl glycosylphosphotransferase